MTKSAMTKILSLAAVAALLIAAIAMTATGPYHFGASNYAVSALTHPR